MMQRLPTQITEVINSVVKYLSHVRNGGLLNRQLKNTMGIINANNGMPIAISNPSLNPIRQLCFFIGDKVTVNTETTKAQTHEVPLKNSSLFVFLCALRAFVVQDC